MKGTSNGTILTVHHYLFYEPCSIRLACEFQFFVFSVCTIPNVLLPQAPGLCKWPDVQHLVGGSGLSFFDFAKKLPCIPLHLPEAPAMLELSGDFTTDLQIIEMNWLASKWQRRRDNERVVQPVIHAILTCAIHAAEMEKQDRQYLVVADPSVVKNSEDCLSDETVIEFNKEIIAEDGLMRILVGIKGTEVFPYSFPKSDRSCAVFCRVIQEAALDLQSGLWKRELLCAIATRDKWFTFRILDKTTDGQMQLHIEESTSIKLSNPKYSMTSIKECVHFLAQYLCKDIL